MLQHILTLFTLVLAIAAPAPPGENPICRPGECPAPTPDVQIPTFCTTTGIDPYFPPGQGFSLPVGQELFAVTLGRGVQNYTCVNGKYKNVGGVAKLYDIGCFLHDLTDPSWVNPGQLADRLPPIVLETGEIEGAQAVLQHTYVPRPGSKTGAIAPRFFSDETGAEAILEIASTAAAPDARFDIDWRYLTALSGHNGLADTVLRTSTAGGKAPNACLPDLDTFSAKYVALYYFYRKVTPTPRPA